MKSKKDFIGKIGIVCLSTLFSVMLALPALADDVSDSRQLVEKAVMTFDDFTKAPEMNAFRVLVKRAKGVLIVPQFLKGAFVVGGAEGTGLLVARGTKTGQWKGPAFYTIGEGSFGLQAGAEASEVILLAMTERGVMALLSSSAKLGADANAAAGPVGVGVAASTANLSADILSFSRSKGLFAGIAVDGAVVAVRNGLNHAYYGKMCSPTDIVIRKSVSNPRARTLLERVTRAGKK
jgi:lipid-binding SYLF domain-containing protein